MLEALAGERAGKLKIAKLNVDENPRSAARFAVQAIPTMIVFRGPLEVDQIRGALPKAALEGAPRPRALTCQLLEPELRGRRRSAPQRAAASRLMSGNRNQVRRSTMRLSCHPSPNPSGYCVSLPP